MGKIIESLWEIFHVSVGMKNIFEENPVVAYRRPRYIKDEIILSKVKRVNINNKGMRKGRQSRCQIFKYLKEGCEFNEGSGKFYINFAFDCDSEGEIYLILCAKCGKKYVGSAITSFRKLFNNHNTSMNRYGKGQRGIADE